MGQVLRLSPRIVFFAIDILCLVLFSIGMFLFYKVGKPFQRGFYCNDESISKPYKDSTIPTATAIGVALNVTIIVLIELVNDHKTKMMKRAGNGRRASEFVSDDGSRCENHIASVNEENEIEENVNGCINIPPALGRICWILFVCFYGAVITGFITDMGKYSVGRLRPHFLSICKPKWNIFNCTNELARNVYITENVCKGTEAYKDKDSRLSFPSGHASFSAFIMVFLVLYLEAKLHFPKEIKVFKVLLQVVLISLALYCGFSRVSDYKHHWSDVLAGLSLGTIVAFIMVTRVLKFRFRRTDGIQLGMDKPGGVNNKLETSKYV